MASEPVEDDDAWLYGDNSTEEQRKEEINAIYERATEDVTVPGEESDEKITTNGDLSQELPDPEPTENGEADGKEEEEGEEKGGQDDEEKDSEDDDDSDDDVQITIGDIKPATAAYPYAGAPVNLNIKRGSAFSSGTVGSSIKQKGLDLETVGLINGVSIYEFNLDSIEDKPWRKPGADITDYFNYGFNEETWKSYCEKQRKLRLDNSLKAPVVVVPGKDQQIPIATVNENSKYSGFMPAPKKAGPPPGRRTSGSIDVICGANPANRRTGNAKENVIQVMTGRTENYDGSVPGSLPPTHIPPPFIPPNLSVPPPGLPPGMAPPTIPPPGTVPGHVPFPDLYGNPIFSQPPPPVPGVSVDVAPQYDEQFFTGSSSHSYANSDSGQHGWGSRDRERGRERDRDRDRERERHRNRSREREREHHGSWDRSHERDRSSGRASTEEEYLKRREEYERKKYREYRERREKERYDREHDRDRERDRDYHEREERRDSRERERERKSKDYKDREERHRDRSSRRHRHHEEDDEHHSSRHRHKKSKREKDETSSLADVSDTTSQQEAPEIKEEVC